MINNITALISNNRSSLLRINTKYAITILIILVIISFIQTMGKAYRPDGYDLSAYLYGAQALKNGTDPYYQNLPFIYIYPLFLGFIMIPLTYLPYWSINVIWFCINITCIITSTIFILKILNINILTESKKIFLISSFLATIICFSPIHNSLLNGQVNLIVLACIVIFYQRFSTNREISSALWLSTAIAIKLTPAIFLFFLFFRRKYSTLIISLFLTLFLIFIPVVLCGEKIIDYYNFYINHFILHKFSIEKQMVTNMKEVALGFNLQSVIGLSYPIALKSLPLKIFSTSTTALLVLFGEYSSSKNSNGNIFMFCAYLCASLLLSPMGENHHTVIIYPVVLIYFYTFLSSYKKDKTDKTYFNYFILFCLCFMFLPGLLKASTYYFFPLLLLMIMSLKSSKRIE